MKVKELGGRGELGQEFVDAPGEVTRQAAKEKRSAITRRAQAQRDARAVKDRG